MISLDLKRINKIIRIKIMITIFKIFCVNAITGSS